MNKYISLTFDIEEWFQVENLRDGIDKNSWNERKSSVEKNTRILLKVLADYDITATFFILGWVAERAPKMIEDIASAGHEIACHGSGHDLTYSLTDEALVADISHARSVLEKYSGQKVVGYRAPNFSVDDRVLDVLKQLDFHYDSSYNPFKFNSRYGSIDGRLKKIKPDLYRAENGLYEIGVSATKLGKLVIPIGGGAYFRLLPLPVFQKLVEKKLTETGFYNFYLHPWEVEPEQPRIKNIKLNHRFRHYYGLRKTERKFRKFLTHLRSTECIFIKLSDYIKNV